MKYVTFLNYGCLDICKNMLESAKKAGISPDSFVIYCLDDKSFNALNGNYSCIRYTQTTSSEYKNWSFDSTSEFRQIVKYKWSIIKEAYKQNKSLCFIDTDIVILKNFSFLTSTFDGILCQSDLPGSLICSGFMIFGDSVVCQNLIDECSNMEEQDDQLAINGIYHKYQDYIKLLPQNLFPNGHVYYQQNIKDPNAYIVHNNFMVGIDNKIQKFKDVGLWFL